MKSTNLKGTNFLTSEKNLFVQLFFLIPKSYSTIQTYFNAFYLSSQIFLYNSMYLYIQEHFSHTNPSSGKFVYFQIKVSFVNIFILHSKFENGIA